MDIQVSRGIKSTESSAPSGQEWEDAYEGILYNGVIYPYDSPFIPQFIIDELEKASTYV